MSSWLDRAHFVSYAKWLAFFICTSGFIWKMSDSFSSYLSQDIGTKTDLKANYEADLPGLAICRHPNQITKFWDPLTNETFESQFNLTLAELRFIKAYKARPDEGLEPLLNQFLFNDSSCVRGNSFLN